MGWFLTLSKLLLRRKSSLLIGTLWDGFFFNKCSPKRKSSCLISTLKMVSHLWPNVLWKGRVLSWLVPYGRVSHLLANFFPKGRVFSWLLPRRDGFSPLNPCEICMELSSDLHTYVSQYLCFLQGIYNLFGYSHNLWIDVMSYRCSKLGWCLIVPNPP